MKQNFAFPAFLTLIFLVTFMDARAASLKIVDGRVAEVRSKERELVLAYRHPVTRREEKLVLQVDQGTGFYEGVHLEDLRPEQPVSVDYEEGPSGLKAVRVRQVPIRGIPKEIHL